MIRFVFLKIILSTVLIDGLKSDTLARTPNGR